MEKNKEFLKTSRLQKTYEGLFASSDKPTPDCLTPALTFDEKCKADEVVQDIGCWKRFKKYCTRKIFNLETYFKQSYMSNVNNIPPTTQTKVVEKKIKEKVQVRDLGLRPLPEVDYNELQYIVEPVYPVYPGQNVLVKEPVNLGYTNQRVVQPGPSMVRNQPYVQKQIKIKEKIKEPNVM